MISSDSIFKIFIYCVPIISSLTWALIMVLSFGDSITRFESHIKRILMFYFFNTMFTWTGLLIYNYYFSFFVYLNSFFFFSFILVPIIFYHFIYAFTTGNEPSKFNRLHYVIPISLSVILFVWSFFIPFDAQVTLVENRRVIHSGYPAYSILFLSKPIVRIFLGVIYMSLSFLQLRRYYILVSKDTKVLKEPSGWIVQLMIYVASLLIFSIIEIINFRVKLFESPVFDRAMTFIIIILIVAQHIILVYNVVTRNFLLYTVDKKMITRDIPRIRIIELSRSKTNQYNKNANDLNSKISVKLNRKNFDNYMQEQKPYLNPFLKITDVTEQLRVNRTYLSNFINRTYGVNFNRYINRYRILELNRLSKLPSNAGKDFRKILPVAGFSSFRNYVRAKAAEDNNNTQI